jgi:hypothetical protein
MLVPLQCKAPKNTTKRRRPRLHPARIPLGAWSQQQHIRRRPGQYDQQAERLGGTCHQRPLSCQRSKIASARMCRTPSGKPCALAFDSLATTPHTHLLMRYIRTLCAPLPSASFMQTRSITSVGLTPTGQSNVTGPSPRSSSPHALIGDAN